MPIRKKHLQRSECRLCRILLGVIAFGTAVLSNGLPVSGQNVSDDIFSPPPGRLTRYLEEAKAALGDEDYPTAIENLSQILLPDSSNPTGATEDHFLPTRRMYATKSIRREVQDLIGNLPQRGQSVFELKFGIAARKKLVDAVTAGDWEKIREVSANYFHTRAGHVATFMLGRQRLSDGEFPAAVRLFAKLDRQDLAKSSLDPQLTIQYAIALYGCGKKEESIEKLFSLKHRRSNLEFLYNGKIHTLPLSDEESMRSFVNDIFNSNQRSDHRPKIIAEWLSYRSDGNLSHGENEIPLPLPVWSVSTWGIRAGELFKSFQTKRESNNLPNISIFQPVTVKGSVIFRSLNHTFAIDLKSGKRIWQYPWNHQEPSLRITDWQQVDRTRIQQELWANSINGQISSDGERVFFVESGEPTSLAGTRISPLRASQASYQPGNTLVSLKIINGEGMAVEGQLAWKISSRQAKWSGAVFLGPPALKDGVAYVLYERDGQVRVGALNAHNGELQWTQQIASTQSHDSFAQKKFRHRKAVTPVIVDGLLICPTMIGGLVAIDLADRNLLWGFKYKSLTMSRLLGDFEDPAGFGSWIDQALFEIEGNLCFSPMDSRDCYVIDLDSGKVRTTIPKADYWIVAGKYRDRLVLLDGGTVTLKSATGYSESKISFIKHGQLSGTGFFADQFLFLPLANQKLIKVDLERKNISEVVEINKPLGNLSLAEGTLISQTIGCVNAYRLKSSAAAENNDNRQKESDSASSQLLQAQLHYVDDQLDLAIDSAIRSVQKFPTDTNCEFLTKLMTRRFADVEKVNWKTMNLGYSLLESPDHQRAFLLAKIESQMASGHSLETVNDMIKLVDLYASESSIESDLVNLSAEHSLSGFRWLRSRLREVANQLEEPARAKFTEKLSIVYRKIIADGDLNQCRLMAKLFGDLDFVNQSLKQLVNKSLQQKSDRDLIWLEALILELLQRESRPQKKIELYRLLAEIKVRLHEAPDRYSRFLAHQAFDTILHKIESLDLPQSYPAAVDLKEFLKLHQQKRGAIFDQTLTDGMAKLELHENDDSSFLLVDAQDQRYRSKLKFSRRLSPLPFQLEFDDRGFFFVRDSDGNLVYQNNGKSRGSRHHYERFSHSHYQILGDLLIVNCGYEHVALDISKIASLRENPSSPVGADLLVGETSELDDIGVLWRFNSFQPASATGVSRLSRESNGLELMVTKITDSGNFRIGRTSLLSSTGYCLLAADTLFCLDPWTGQVVWKRTGLPPGCDLFGNQESVYVLAPNEKQIAVYSAVDGRQISEQAVLPGMVNRIASHGSTVVSISENDKNLILSGFRFGQKSIASSWSQSWEKGTRADWIDATNLALLTAGGKFQILNIESGKIHSQHSLDLREKFSTLQVEQFGNNLLILANQNNLLKIIESQNEAGNSRQVIRVNGQIMLLGKSGPRWSQFARLEDYDLILNQPDSTPAILFKKPIADRRSEELVFLRQSDGSSIEFHDALPHVGVTTNVIHRRGVPDSAITFNMGYHWFDLRLTRLPRPPEPPAQLGLYGNQIQAPETQLQEMKDKTEQASDPADPFRSKRNILEQWMEKEWKHHPLSK